MRIIYKIVVANLNYEKEASFVRQDPKDENNIYLDFFIPYNEAIGRWRAVFVVREDGDGVTFLRLFCNRERLKVGSTHIKIIYRKAQQDFLI